jgi:hypothetical protein
MNRTTVYTEITKDGPKEDWFRQVYDYDLFLCNTNTDYSLHKITICTNQITRYD